VVTSRDRLSGLVAAEGADPITLDLLSPPEARELLAGRIGVQRVAAEPEAVDTIVERCAHLPLALAITAAQAATQPSLSLARVAEELRGKHQLDALSGPDAATDIREVFLSSYRNLSTNAARLFRLLGLHPGPDFAVPAVASLAGLPPAEVVSLLAELIEAHLLIENVAGRYTFHDLLRAFAIERTNIVDPEADRRVVLHRVLDHYLHTGYRAALLLSPQRERITLDPAQPGVVPEDLANQDAAFEWCAAEHRGWQDTINEAAAAGFDTHVWKLAWTVADYVMLRGHWHDWLGMQEVALRAARRLGDLPTRAHVHCSIAGAYTWLSRYQDAETHLSEAIRLYAKLGDPLGQAHAQLSMSRAAEWQGDHKDALRHAERALDLYATAGHRGGKADALNTIGWEHARLGDYRRAVWCCDAALAAHLESGDERGQAYALDSLGYARHHLLQHEQAVSDYRRALTIFRQLGDLYSESLTLTNLGDTYAAAGDPRSAGSAWQTALGILDELGHADANPVRARLERRDR
jgi:tetratricopeptide (TPR) repeat protein